MVAADDHVARLDLAVLDRLHAVLGAFEYPRGAGEFLRPRAVADAEADHGGLRWDAYDRRDEPDPGNVEYALVTETGASTIVLGGTASDAEFAELASAVAESLS